MRSYFGSDFEASDDDVIFTLLTSQSALRFLFLEVVEDNEKSAYICLQDGTVAKLSDANLQSVLKSRLQIESFFRKKRYPGYPARTA